MYPKKIREIEKVLKTLRFEDNRGGRQSSTKDEQFVREQLAEAGINLVKDLGNSLNDISWHDGLVSGLVCNIKITSFKNADNISSKGAIPYVFCDLDLDNDQIAKTIETLNNGSWEDFYKFILANLSSSDNGRDYYYLVCNRQEPSLSFVTSMRYLSKLTLNTVNPPFQVRWTDNRPNHNLSFDQSKRLIMGTLHDLNKKDFLKSSVKHSLTQKIMKKV